MPPSNAARLARVYGPTTWAVYDRLDRSLGPTGADRLHDLAAPFLPPGGRVLDVGCRDAAHLVRLVRDHDARGLGVEPVPLHVERAHAAVEAAGLADRVEVRLGGAEDLTPTDGEFDLVWCRDVLTQVADRDAVVDHMARALAPDGRLVAYTTFATERLDGSDAAMMARHLGNVPGGLDRTATETAFAAAGLVAEAVHEVGSEWAEHAEEVDQQASRALLRLSRLRRQRDEVVAEHGRDGYEHVEANLHWPVFLLTGKLSPVVHVLRRS